MMKSALAVLVAVVAAGVLACGSSSSNTSSYTCCINGQFYTCPNADAVSDCVNKCTRDSSGDAPSGSTTCTK